MIYESAAQHSIYSIHSTQKVHSVHVRILDFVDFVDFFGFLFFWILWILWILWIFGFCGFTYEYCNIADDLSVSTSINLKSSSVSCFDEEQSRQRMRATRSFRSRARARGIRNVPATPRLYRGQGNSTAFDFTEEEQVSEEETNGPILWVKCKASEEEGGGFCYRPGRLLGKGKRINTYSFQIEEEGESFVTSVERVSIGPPVDSEFVTKANMVDILNVHEVSEPAACHT